MRTDDFRQSLDALAGDDPSVDAGFATVTKTVRRHRARTWTAVATACVVVVAVAAFGIVQRGDNAHKVTVTNPQPKPDNVANLHWTREPAPQQMDVSRIVVADGQTLAVGTSLDAQPAIGRFEADGTVTDIVDPADNPADDRITPPPTGSIHDLVSFRGAWIAVGTSDAGGHGVAAAWRSTDDGRTWQRVTVETDLRASLDRVVSSRGVLYAVGTNERATSHCAVFMMSSRDGLDFGTAGKIGCDLTAYIADGPAGVVVATPGDASAWTLDRSGWAQHSVAGLPAGANAKIFAVAGSTDGYVAVGSVGVPNAVNSANGMRMSGMIWWSTDGKSWSLVAAVPDDDFPATSLRGVAHGPTGWVAAGQREGADDFANDEAIVWTSTDGRHWTATTRDGDAFEQNAWAAGVARTTSGYAISGTSNVRTPVLWIGAAPGAIPTGTVEGSMAEIGGLMRGARPVAGTLTATGAEGTQHTAPVDSEGHFSVDLPPGTYTVVGHSPVYGSGQYPCAVHDGSAAVVAANRVTRVQLVCRIR